MQKMNPDVKAQWLVALRSGEYPQGLHALQRENKFCCLGVLCDISKQGEWTITAGIERLTYDMSNANSSTSLPHPIGDWSGVVISAMDELIAMNDYGKSFSEISNWIEENL